MTKKNERWSLVQGSLFDKFRMKSLMSNLKFWVFNHIFFKLINLLAQIWLLVLMCA